MADTFSFDDLVTPVTRAEAQASIYEVLDTLGVNTTAWKPGNVVRSVIVGASLVLSALSQLQAKIARSGFLELAEGEWLRHVAHYVYGVDFIAATFAVGEITLTNSGGGVYSFDPGDLIFANPTTGKTYRNIEAVSLGALATARVAISATEVGAASSSGVGDITQMVTTVLGLTCENAAQLTGSDEESDTALRTRCQEKLGSLSPFGPWDPYAFAVRSATHADGTALGINRIRIVKDGFGTVTTYLAGPSGAIPGDPDDPTTDLGIAHDAIKRKAVPVGVTAVTASATAHAIPVTFSAWAYESIRTDAELEDTIADALEAFLRSRPIGGDVIGIDSGKVFVDGLRAAIVGAAPELFHAAITLPASDVVLTGTEVPTFTGATATAIHRMPAPEGFGGALST